MDTIKTVGVLVFRGDEVLLVKHGETAGHVTGTYGIVAGRIDEGETEIQAAVRELKEESGLEASEEALREVKEKEYVADIKRSDGNIKRYSLKLFVCLEYSGDLRADYETVPEWVAMADVPRLNLLPNVDKMIRDGNDYLNELTKIKN